MRALNAVFSAAANGRQLTIDRNCRLVGVCTSTTGICLISEDPAATTANRATAGSDQTYTTDIACFAGIGVPFLMTQSLPLYIELFKGAVIYISRSSAGNIMLFFLDAGIDYP